MKKILFLIILHIFIFKSHSQSKIVIGEKFKIFSKTLNEEREYWISLPDNYNDTIYEPEKYPVTFFLDGDRHFQSLTGIHDFLSKGPYASLPEMILVGILTTKNRTRDLTPTSVKQAQTGKNFVFKDSGGNENFMIFLKNELLPKIEKDYRTNGYKTIIGHSFGGLTVLNTLFTEPKLFNSYIAIDPSIWWDDEYVLKKAINKLQNSNLEENSLYFSLAYEETIPENIAIEHENAINKFKNSLENLKSELNWKFQFLKEEDHGTISLPSEYYGLKFIYDGYQLPVKELASNTNLVTNLFDKLSKKMDFEIKPAESRIDWIASYCFKIGKPQEAIQLLKINLKNYPNSENVYTSLSNAYKKTGNNFDAKSILEKGLKLLPKSERIRYKIKELK
ncbi:hypothetical protein C7447_101666 [Tenacibaculum adriaticum]|uniref:Uncharacterized protein n=1 Tax=Tenacibaculum adriaticum TaxID=413713 RepID=A0A5S5DVU1_9FLAO|nr:alpha/beta hydrolase-fold protein [Tenacibaculum adriaticum]TYQ00058.1 hypothetical protein C7447_101666 [Tenacibaculum adriaticum]